MTLETFAADTTLPPTIVTGTRLPQSEAPVSQSVIVIPEQEVRERAPATLPELLRGRSAVYVDQPGAPGGFSSFYLRGADPNHTVIMIDGVKMNDPTNQRGGGIDLSLIDPRTISRVEILPGASSALYGADAMAGAMNIITRAPRQSGVRASAGAGGDGFRSAHATGSYVSGATGLTAEGAMLEDGRTSDDAFVRLKSASLRLNAGTPGDISFTAWVRGHHHESKAFPEDSGGARLAVRRLLERRETDGYVGAVSGETRAPWGALRLYANVFSQDADIDSPGVAPGVRDPMGLPRSISVAHYRRSTAGAVAVIGSAADAPALIGAEYEKEDGTFASTLFFGPFALPANFSLERHTRSVFGEGRHKLSERITLHAGLRADFTERHGTHTTFRAGAAFRPSQTLPTLAVNYGTGFKPPSFFALGHPLVGNPNLKPEESRTLEVSASSDEARVASRPVGYRVALFASKYRDLVDFDAGPPPRLVNRREVEIKGYEASATARPTDRLNVRAAVTGLSFDLPAGISPLRSRPRFRGTAGAAYNITPELTASLFGSYVSRVFDSSIPTGGMYLSPHAVVDASLVYAFRRARLTLALDNLLDRDYEQFIGFPGRGRRARFEVAFEI